MVCRPTGERLSQYYSGYDDKLACLENTTLDHYFHPVNRNPSDLIDRFFEGIWRKILIQLNIVHFPGMFDLNRDGWHGGGIDVDFVEV